MDRTSNFISRWLQFDFALLRTSLCVLPYISYLGLAGLVILLGALLIQFKRSALNALTRSGLVLIAGLLVLSCGLADNRAEAFLQLANFLPFFLLFSVVPFVLNSTDRLEQLAWSLVITTIPINGFALVEYILKSDFIPKSIYRHPIVKWARSQPHTGRAIVNFNHPNALASYLVLILGLGLGLILYHAVRKQTDVSYTRPGYVMPLLYGGTYVNLIGIFGSGSRNGLLVAILQLVLFGFLWGLLLGLSRVVLLTSLVSLGGILVGAIEFGIGGRSLFSSDWANDPRLRVWAISLSLLQQRPWLGWGLGNYKFQFADRLLSLFPACSSVRSRRVVPVECADVTHAHNFWLTMATEAGVLVAIGLTLWVGYLCFQAVKALIDKQLQPADRALLIGYLLAFLGCIAFACFDVTLYDARVNTLNWVILAGIYTIANPFPKLGTTAS